jgi:hypothetical protein
MSHSEVYNGHVLASSKSSGAVVLANPCAWHGLMVISDFRGRRGGFCACQRTALRGSSDRGPHLVVIRTHIKSAHACLRASFMGEGSGGWQHRC